MECNKCFAIQFFIKRIANSGKRVLLAIDEGYVNTSKIAAHINLKNQAVSRTLSELRALGVVDVEFKKTKAGVTNLKIYDYKIVDDPLIEILLEKLKED